jgi:hypothetical protein
MRRPVRRRLRHPAAASAVACALLAVACATTEMTSTWRDPALGALQFRKVAGIALSADATLRRIAEDEFVRDVGPAHGVAGYTLIPDEELRDRETARARLEAGGVDGAVVYRLVSVDERERWVPPTTYGSMWGYWGWAGPMVYEPGYLTTDQYVQVETAVYSVPDARLVWAGRSRTINPDSAEELIDEVVRVSVEELRKEQLIP